MKLYLLAKSSLKKNISSAITLFFLIAIATIFLYIGFIIFFRLDGFLDEKNASLNGADYIAIALKSDTDKVKSIITGMDGLDSLESEDVVFYNSAQFQNKRAEKKAQNINILFMNADIQRSVSKLKIIGGEGPMSDSSIVVPYCLKTSNGYKIGDKIDISYMDHTASFVIYGFSEDVMFSTATNVNCYKCYVPNENFVQLYDSATVISKFTLFKAKLDDGQSSEDFDGTFNKLASKDKSLNIHPVMGLNYETMKVGTKFMINIIMMILIFFAALVLIISMVVIRYTVITHIEEDIKNIGSMEAAGFTNAMIRSALILQFLFIAIIGYLGGIAISTSFSGAVTNVISSSIGLNWQTNVNFISMIITLVTILLLIISITFKVTHRIGKITPIMALRNGIETFHFGRNYLPFETTRGNINLIVGLKQIFNNKKQSISIAIIGILMSFTMLFAFSAYYNFVSNNKTYLNLIGMEKSNIVVSCQNNKYKEVFQKASKMEGIRKVLRYTEYDLTLMNGNKEVSTVGYVSNNFKSVEISTIIEGRNPIHDNEIVLSTMIQKKLNAKIDDIVSIKNGSTKTDYLVVGISQHISHLGKSASITEEGMKRSNPNFTPNSLYLYLDQSKDTQKVVDQLTKELTGYDVTLTNMDDAFNTMMSSITQSITLICIIIGIITALIIALILFYLVKVKILREKTTLGIQKALGFTTGQLVLHNNIALVTVIFISTLIGSIFAAILINPLCTLLLSMSGLKRCDFIIPGDLILATIGIMTLLTVFTTTLVSVRIRKLNPRELIAD